MELKGDFMEIENKKAVSATVIGIILLVIGLAIIIMFVIFAGKSGQGGIDSMIQSLDLFKGGGTG